MTREDIAFMLENYIQEKMRLYHLIRKPAENGLDPDTVQYLEGQLDQLCGLYPVADTLDPQLQDVIHRCFLERGLGLPGVRRDNKLYQRQDEALDAMQKAMDARTWDGAYYRWWRPAFESLMALALSSMVYLSEERAQYLRELIAEGYAINGTSRDQAPGSV